MKKRGSLAPIICMVAVCSIGMTQLAFASAPASADSILSGINAVKTLFMGIVSVIGAFIAGKGVLDLSSAVSSQDSSSIRQAVAVLTGGLIAFFGAGVLALMGIS